MNTMNGISLRYDQKSMLSNLIIGRSLGTGKQCWNLVCIRIGNDIREGFSGRVGSKPDGHD